MQLQILSIKGIQGQGATNQLNYLMLLIRGMIISLKKLSDNYFFKNIIGITAYLVTHGFSINCASYIIGQVILSKL